MLLAGALAVSLGACGGGAPTPACDAYGALRDAVAAMNTAQGDPATVATKVDEVDGLVRTARRRLAGAQADERIAPAVRAMQEAANYLEHMVGQFRTDGAVDFSLTRFASRELTRALAGAGGAPLSCRR